MFTALIQMSLLVACGSFWKSHAPAHISALAHRRAITDLVFFLLLPAMVLDVVWRAPLGQSSIQISVLAISGVITGLVVMKTVLRFIKTENAQTGALLLAAAFPNATYLGLPVLDKVIGPSTRVTVIQYDLFACTPILLSFGMLLARYYGSNTPVAHPVKELTKVPPLWAVAIAVMLNLLEVPQPEILHTALSTLAGGVVPLNAHCFRHEYPLAKSPFSVCATVSTCYRYFFTRCPACYSSLKSSDRARYEISLPKWLSLRLCRQWYLVWS